MTKRKHSDDEMDLISETLLTLTRTSTYILDDVARLKNQIMLLQAQLDKLKPLIHGPKSKKRLVINIPERTTDDLSSPPPPPVLRRSCAYMFQTPPKPKEATANQLQWYDDFWSDSDEYKPPTESVDPEVKE